MYICMECNEKFETPDIHDVNLGFRDAYSDAFESCPYCGTFQIYEEETYNGYTFEDMQEKFTVDLGMEYIKQYGIETEFYSTIGDFGISGFETEELNLIVPALKQVFIRRISDNGYLSSAFRLSQDLKAFCLEDWTHFCDFLISQKDKKNKLEDIAV